MRVPLRDIIPRTSPGHEGNEQRVLYPALRPCPDSSHLTWSWTPHAEHCSPQKQHSPGNRLGFHSSREGFASNVSSTISPEATFLTGLLLCSNFIYIYLKNKVKHGSLHHDQPLFEQHKKRLELTEKL